MVYLTAEFEDRDAERESRPLIPLLICVSIFFICRQAAFIFGEFEGDGT
jgi:hypothetical protein